MHCQTSGVSLTEQDPHNNIIRTTIEALAAVLGGTQSLHTNSFDEAMALPTPASMRIARNTQLILAEETGIPHVIDPLGGSYYLESLTHSIAEAATALIGEVEAIGGMTKAVEAGMPKLRIEESAARRQAAIDRGEETIVGVNKYQSGGDDRGRSARCRQRRRAHRADRAARPGSAQARPQALPTGACRADRGGEERQRQPAGIGDRGERGRAPRSARSPTRSKRCSPATAAQIRAVSGVYGGQYQGDEGFRRVQREIEAFARDEGRRPRMLVVKLGQDGHDRGAKVIATAFADIGFDVDIGPLFQTPEEAARQAVENDVHIVGVSSQAAGHKTLVPALIEALKRQGAGDILVVCGGVIPPKDYDFLRKAGVSAIYGPGTNIPQAAAEILSLIRGRRLAA